jgi:hypothetical protein
MLSRREEDEAHRAREGPAVEGTCQRNDRRSAARVVVRSRCSADRVVVRANEDDLVAARGARDVDVQVVGGHTVHGIRTRMAPGLVAGGAERGDERGGRGVEGRGA